MALFQVNFSSAVLQSNTHLNVLLPIDGAGGLRAGTQYPVLYLLHGTSGDYSDWLRYTRIEKYATARNLAVVMPSAGNSFYENMAHGPQILTYLTEELPQFVNAVFPVSAKREDTFVAGLSMGGYGAWRLALQRPDLYSYAASLSGPLDFVERLACSRNGQMTGPHCWEAIFENPDAIEGTDADLFALAAKRIAEGCVMPKLYQTVGTEDFHYTRNQTARKRMTELGLAPTYAEHPGTHNWDYWDAHIQDVLDWLPLAKNSAAE